MNARFNFRDAAPFELTGNGRFILGRKDFVPAYVRAFENGLLQQRATRRSSRCDRAKFVRAIVKSTGQQQDRRLQKRTARARGKRFSAFWRRRLYARLERLRHNLFGWCNLRCVFCQNFETSQFGEGADVGATELGQIMLDLQQIGCHNINFVTPEHVVPQILEALVIAVERGLRLPLVYNTSAYSLESIQWMDDIVDIYMPDFKLWDAEHCRKYLVASDYSKAARNVIAAMRAQVGRPQSGREWPRIARCPR